MPEPQVRPQPSARALDRVGAAITAVFALAWALTGTTAIASDGLANLVRVVALAVTTGGLVAAYAGRTGWGSAREVEVDLPADWRRGFDRIGAVQALSIGLTVPLLLIADAAGLIPAAVCLIVGIHFFPLARVLQQRYRTVGSVLCLVAVSGLVAFLAAGAAASVLIVGSGAALTLWATSFQHVVTGLGVPAGR